MSVVAVLPAAGVVVVESADASYRFGYSGDSDQESF